MWMSIILKLLHHLEVLVFLKKERVFEKIFEITFADDYWLRFSQEIQVKSILLSLLLRLSLPPSLSHSLTLSLSPSLMLMLALIFIQKCVICFKEGMCVNVPAKYFIIYLFIFIFNFFFPI